MNILVLCTGNSCRSQMAEGWLRLFAEGHAEVYSAGIEVHGLDSRAVRVMQEVGVDISSHRSKTIEEVKGIEFDVVITVCDNARERCPYFPARVLQIHRDFPDPALAQGSEQEVLDKFRAVRDQLKHYCQSFTIQHLRREKTM